VKIVKNKINDLVKSGRDHTHPSLDIQAKNEVINDDSAKLRAEHTKHHRLGIVAKCRRQSNRYPGKGNRFANIDLEEFVEDLCHDIKASRGCVSQKQNCHCNTNDQNVAKHVKQRILRKRLKIWEDQFKYAHKSRHHNGRIHRFSTEFGPNEEKANRQQYNVDCQIEHGHGQRNKIAQHHRKCGPTTNRHVAWKHNEKDCRSRQSRAEGDDQKITNLMKKP
jgi:hypothetical protein